MNELILLIAGEAGVGKDTFAFFLKKHIFYPTAITHFADAVKMCAKNFFDWDEKKDLKGRSLLQFVGTEIGRKYDEQIWASLVVDQIKMFSSLFKIFIIPDLRYENEQYFIEDFLEDDKKIVKFFIENQNKENGLEEFQKKHISEKGFSKKDFHFIDNSGSLEELEKVAAYYASFINRGIDF